MRRFGLIIFSLVVIAAGFMVYMKMQPSIRVTSNLHQIGGPNDPGENAPTPGPAGTLVGPGEDAWVNQYNNAGVLVYRFKAHQFKNYADGKADLQNPVAEVFNSSGEIIRIEGQDGTVHAEPGTDTHVVNGGQLRPPHDGYLRNVTLKVFPSLAARDAETPTLTLKTSNARFDSATNRLFTEEFTENGQTIASDQVPVTMVGHDLSQQRDTFVFHGSGLVMYWNEREDRIKSLEIAHGNDLVVYDTSLLEKTKATTPAATPAEKPVAPVTAAPAPTALPPMAPAAPGTSCQDRYLATFFDDVRVWEDKVETISSDTMSIDFAIKHSQSAARGMPAATPAAAAVANQPTPPPSPAAAPPASPPNTTAKDSGPREVVIHWHGKLRMVPNDNAAETLPDGQKIVAFTGAPVKVHRPIEKGHNGFDITCRQVAYHTGDGSLTLASQGGPPVHIIEQRPDRRGAIIDSQFITYSRADAKAILHDMGSLTAPDPNKPEDMLNATWAQGCVLNLLVQPDNSVQVSQADLSGSVQVTHPRFDLNAGELSLRFDPKTAGSKDATASNQDLGKSLELKRMIANTNATVVVHDPDGSQRSMSGQHLEVSTRRDTDGVLFVDTVNGSGQVLAKQAEQSLSAENLHAELAPIPTTERKQRKPGANPDALESNQERLTYMKAWDNVVLHGKDTSQAQGDKLEITMDGDEPVVELFGKPGAPAIVKGKDSTVTGPKITLLRKDQQCMVDGAGTMDTVQQPKDPKAKPQPMHLKWADSAKVDGKANQIDVRGKVLAHAEEAAGSTDEALTEHLVLHLLDKPKDAAAAPPTEKKNPDDQFAFARDKQVSDLSLLGEKSSVVTTLAAPSGAILKRSAIFGRRIDYDVVNKKLAIPGAGSMLEEGHAIGHYKPDNPGATAIQWQKQFVFENATQQATIEGPVLIVHRDDGNNQQRTTIHGDQVLATFEPDKNAATAPSTASTADQSLHLQLKKVVVQGNVLIDLGDSKIESSTVEFDPAEHRLICRGEENLPVLVYDDKHKGGAHFGEVWINVATNTIERLTNLSAHGHK